MLATFCYTIIFAISEKFNANWTCSIRFPAPPCVRVACGLRMQLERRRTRARLRARYILAQFTSKIRYQIILPLTITIAVGILELF